MLNYQRVFMMFGAASRWRISHKMVTILMGDMMINHGILGVRQARIYIRMHACDATISAIWAFFL